MMGNPPNSSPKLLLLCYLCFCLCYHKCHSWVD